MGNAACSSKPAARGSQKDDAEHQDLHPLELLRHLPSHDAVCSVMSAKHRMIRLQTEAQLASYCSDELLPRVQARLQNCADATAFHDNSAAVPVAPGPAVLDALQVMRLAAHVCSDDRS